MQLLEIIERLPSDSHFQAAVAMNEDVGELRAQVPLPERPVPISPLGYSLPVLLQLKMIDLQKDTIRAIGSAFGSKAMPPIPREQRPSTAEARARARQDRDDVNEALRQFGITD
ncbi:hypothetical protein [Prescottella agglutinans]|uniref:Uncharacterized protein n=1 Tax=Prescottella agglutinans TaxID=1644129 RepID=A0ABT6MFY4_9NOCA|nr:hypothetical protein [Prescottella agglutinans]MDH6282800.1 hypothetical protein [Prescottella agglutinans]